MAEPLAKVEAEKATVQEPRALDMVSLHRGPMDLGKWTASILDVRGPVDKENCWIISPFAKHHNPKEWVTGADRPEMKTFWNVTLENLLQHESLRSQPDLLQLLAKTSPESVWPLFFGGWTWKQDTQDLLSLWDSMLQKTALLLNGYPIDAYPVHIPVDCDLAGNSTLHWSVPYRCCFFPGFGRVDGFNASLKNLRISNILPHRFLIANCMWENVVIKNCTFTRCSFRNCTLSNVHFLDCEFVGVDFGNVVILDSLFAATKMYQTMIRNTKFEHVSWHNNVLMNCVFENVRSFRSNRSYAYYEGWDIVDYTEECYSEHAVRIANNLVDRTY